ncbi:cilia and flagella-associated protein 47-like [Cylas formicarius]|uniref:cilia and flagella-associated protein 47-like n=1 Tax=Cylas formicarius TaxID=197179 RepID=UPI0029588892|nr:cilia and flagella-associated protein 47-like [Cylas formicarius]
MADCVTLFDGDARDHQGRVPSCDEEESMDLGGVVVTPGVMVFRDAYDGKSFDRVLTVRNARKRAVFVRLFPPTSKAFKMKPLLCAKRLPCGLSITRNVRYLHTTATTVLQTSMSIYVDNLRVNYELLVVRCYARLCLEPRVLDFGEIDVGHVSEAKTLRLTNRGTKNAQFSIDLGRNESELSVRPLKGTVQPLETKAITVEVLGTSRGYFAQEFWIKGEPLHRVKVQGSFVEPKLALDFPATDPSFLILAFPRSYAGTRQRRSIVFANRSSTRASFCVVAITRDETIAFSDARRKYEEFRAFDAFPTQGRLHPRQWSLVEFTYEPPRRAKNPPNYHICLVRIDVVKCSVGHAPDTKSEHVLDQITSVASPLLDVPSQMDFNGRYRTDEVVLIDDSIRVCLYGEVEPLLVRVTPDEVDLRDSKVNETRVVAVTVANDSKRLAVRCGYVKRACVEAFPRDFDVGAGAAVEVALRVTPTKMGDESVTVAFDVRCVADERRVKLKSVHCRIKYRGTYSPAAKTPSFLPGITPLVAHEVGYLVDEVTFDSDVAKPRQAVVDKGFRKTDNALVAFPNDRPRSLRPWRSTKPCRTIFANLPRCVATFDERYDLEPDHADVKRSNDAYYDRYIKELSAARRRVTASKNQPQEDYETTDIAPWLTQPPPNWPSARRDAAIEKPTPTSLNAYELRNIVVSPRFIDLGKLALGYARSASLTVRNGNDFPVRVSLKAMYSTLTFPRESFAVAAHASVDVTFAYRSHSMGKRHVPLYVVVNLFHVFEATVLAQVIASTVKCVTKEIFIDPTEKVAFLELRNPLNSNVRFAVDTKYFHLKAFPSEGTIPSRANMVCTVTFRPGIGYLPLKEITVISESGAKELVEVYFGYEKAPIGLSVEEIAFEHVPINVTVVREFVVRNDGNLLIQFSVEEEGLMPELTVSPTKALVNPKGEIIVAVAALFRYAAEFCCPLKMVFQHEYSATVRVSGNVVCPEVAFEPQMIKMEKIPAGAVASYPFKMTNRSAVRTTVTFPLDDLEAFAVHSRTGEPLDAPVELEPDESRTLSVVFKPMEPAAFCVYLPYVLNGLIGPPELNRPESLLAKTHFRSTMTTTDRFSKASAPERIGTLKILCAASSPWLVFNALDVSFGPGDVPRVFEMVNVAERRLQVSLDAGALRDFTIEASPSPFALDPDDRASVTVTYVPRDFGDATERLAIFVGDDLTSLNYLTLRGRNPRPALLCDVAAVYLPAIANDATAETTVVVGFDPHLGCERVTCESGDSCLRVTSERNDARRYRITFEPRGVDRRIESHVKFSCGCWTTCVVVNACSDSCTLINFASSLDAASTTTYPYFPEKDDASFYARRMTSVVPVIERWLYSQGFFCRNYCRVPEDIARFPVRTGGGKRDAKARPPPRLPLVQLLVNLMDASILKYIDSGSTPGESLDDLVLHNYTTYRDTISFLKSQKVWVPGLRPEHLLPYSEYRHFRTSFVDKERPSSPEPELSEGDFYLFSKQKWIELFFHLYKTLVLERAVELRATPSCVDFAAYREREANRFRDSHPCETTLLLWLEYHYEREKRTLWGAAAPDTPRRLHAFREAYDSGPLATVTIAYCPYLADRLGDLYVAPKNEAELTHNACRVVQAWKSLNLSFDIHPSAIVKAYAVKILLIVTYLYDVLPSFHPEQTVTIEAPLSGRGFHDLQLRNCGDATVQYRAIFFGNGAGRFGVDNVEIQIVRRGRKRVRVTYAATEMLPVRATLVLSGESSGYRYAKSTAFVIVGVPSVANCQEINLVADVYRATARNLQVVSPYVGVEYVADVRECHGAPSTPSDLRSVREINASNLPREVNVVHDSCEFGAKKSSGSVRLRLCFLSPGRFSFYLFFCCRGVGDFCVVVNVTAQIDARTHCETVPVAAPQLNTCVCDAAISARCPRSLRVAVPSRNNLLAGGLRSLLRMCLPEKYRTFWDKHADTPLLFRILKFYVNLFPDSLLMSSSIFSDSGVYVVAPDPHFTSQNATLEVKDVTSEDTMDLVIHWEAELPLVEQILELRNTNNKEVRYYKLVVTQ